MPKRQTVHDDDNCNLLSEKPTENEIIAININPNDEVIAGYYRKDKWFYADHREIPENIIICWHKQEK